MFTLLQRLGQQQIKKFVCDGYYAAAVVVSAIHHMDAVIFLTFSKFYLNILSSNLSYKFKNVVVTKFIS